MTTYHAIHSKHHMSRKGLRLIGNARRHTPRWSLAALFRFRFLAVKAARSRVLLAILAVATHPASSLAQNASARTSDWARVNSLGHLSYRSLPTGDHIMDFSYAGYGGGGRAIPVVPVKRTVSPSGNDDSAAIQAALDEVEALPLRRGFRGTGLRRAGVFL